MQLNGVGGEHTQDFHQITNHIGRHPEPKTEKGGGRMDDTGVGSVPQTQEATGSALAMPGWLRSVIGGGRQVWGRIWGDNVSGGEKAGEETTAGAMAAAESAGGQAKETAETTEVSELARAAAQSTLVPVQSKENPYFTPIAQDAREKNVWEKTKVKFQKITKYLSHRFSGQDNLKKGNDRPAKDLSKRSRYSGKDVKIDCILTDDSYLLDSYDRKGKYTQLSAKK